MPAPPYCCAIGPPSRPIGAILRMTASGKRSLCSFALTYGAISLWAKRRAVSRMSCWSSLRLKSTARSSLAPGCVPSIVGRGRGESSDAAGDAAAEAEQLAAVGLKQVQLALPATAGEGAGAVPEQPVVPAV